MRRWIVYLMALFITAAVGILPFRGTDVGKLLPVETVRLTKQDDKILLETDTAGYGIGNDIQSALENLKATAMGNVFLDTADYLIVTPGGEDLLLELYAFLRPNCSICIQLGNAEVAKITEFLENHEPELTLQEYRGGLKKIPVMMIVEERMELVQ